MPTTGPSQHLSWRELSCKDGTAYPVEWRVSRAVPLAIEFERIRAAVGRPIVVGSAYRTPTHNRNVGGARNSQHVQGRALDLYPPRGWTVTRLFEVVRAVAADPASRIFGIGEYPSFVHLDIRPAPPHGQLIRWRGSRAWAEVKI